MLRATTRSGTSLNAKHAGRSNPFRRTRSRHQPTRTAPSRKNRTLHRVPRHFDERAQSLLPARIGTTAFPLYPHLVKKEGDQASGAAPKGRGVPKEPKSRHLNAPRSALNSGRHPLCAAALQARGRVRPPTRQGRPLPIRKRAFPPEGDRNTDPHMSVFVKTYSPQSAGAPPYSRRPISTLKQRY